jgi:hypothetical protein
MLAVFRFKMRRKAGKSGLRNTDSKDGFQGRIPRGGFRARPCVSAPTARSAGANTQHSQTHDGFVKRFDSLRNKL